AAVNFSLQFEAIAAWQPKLEMVEPMDEAGQARSWNLELRAPKAAFTLVELLVAVAVIAILAALLLPALGRTKQQAQGVYCLNSGHSLMLALSPNCCRRIIARL